MAMNFGMSDFAQVGVAAYLAPQDYRRRIQEGGSPLSALGSAAGNAFVTSALSLTGGMLLPMIPLAAKAAYGAGVQSGIDTRAKAMPFSSRYEASEMGSRMQSYALGRMGEMAGFGNEASMMMGRYGRG